MMIDYDAELMEIAKRIVERGLYRPDERKPEIERTGVPLELPLPPRLPPTEKR